jgi:o-succinylbenzoate synthase
MQIDSLELFHVAVPLSDSSVVDGENEIESVLIALRSGDQVGWGEAAVGRAPIDSAEWAGSAYLFIKDLLGPAIVGESVSSGHQLTQRLASFEGNQFAKAALDMAWWDLEAQRSGRTLANMFGQSGDQPLIAVEVTPRDSIDALLEYLKSLIARGQSRFHLRFRPGWDIEMLRAVTQSFPSLKLSVGCGGQLTLDQRDLLYRLDDFHLAYIEQPLVADDLVGHAMLQDSIRTPIALRASVTSVERVRQAIDLAAARHLVIEPGRAGGLTSAREIIELCRQESIPCTIASRQQTVVGAALDRLLAALPGAGEWLTPRLVPLSDSLLNWPRPSSDDVTSATTVPSPPRLSIESLAPFTKAQIRL